jgi:glycosyltransferase involved in cell wall biosynthesis
MQRKSICILTGSHLCHNPRVIKEATTLAAAGYEVEVLGAWLDPELKRKDEMLAKSACFSFRPVIDLAEKGFKRQQSRAKSKAGRLAHRLLGFENRWQLGLAVSALTKAARQSKADFFIAHSEPALWATSQFSTLNSQLGIDMEDWFSEDLLPEARKHRPLGLLKRLEHEVLSRAVYATCTSHAMADALAREYDCQPPLAIYNAFRWSDRANLDGKIKDRHDGQLPSIHWYSQALGLGRGLEDLIAALPLVEHEAEIHLRGKPAPQFLDWLRSQLTSNWRNRVFIHDLVSNEELLSRITEHDIGFAGEQKYCKSRDLTVTNKILHYLLAGLAVVASDTSGQREVAEQAPGAVYLYRAGDAQDLAGQLNQLLSSKADLAEAKEAALAAARGTFCWERQAPKLLDAVESALTLAQF